MCLARLQNVRREFVTGVLSEEELGNKIFVHHLRDGYATRVSNLRAYDAVRRLGGSCSVPVWGTCCPQHLPEDLQLVTGWYMVIELAHDTLDRPAGEPRRAAEVDVSIHTRHQRAACAPLRRRGGLVHLQLFEEQHIQVAIRAASMTFCATLHSRSALTSQAWLPGNLQ